MATKQRPAGGRTAAEREAAKRRAFNVAQKKRKAGDATSVSKLMADDLKKNEAKYVIEMRRKKSKAKKKPKKK